MGHDLETRVRVPALGLLEWRLPGGAEAAPALTVQLASALAIGSTGSLLQQASVPGSAVTVPGEHHDWAVSSDDLRIRRAMSRVAR
jgi:hypothetical protein